jgi:short-subunit dehydrogenase
MGFLSVTTAFVPIVQSNGGGAIANVLSVVSWYVYPFNATHLASKHAALALTDGLIIQLRSAGSNDGVFGSLAEMSQTALRV